MPRDFAWLVLYESAPPPPPPPAQPHGHGMNRSLWNTYLPVLNRSAYAANFVTKAFFSRRLREI